MNPYDDRPGIAGNNPTDGDSDNSTFDPARRRHVGAMLGLAAGTIGAGIAAPGAAATTRSDRCTSTNNCRIALVLGGGCHRALAHVGVIKVLEANGIMPDLIVGTSAGSMVGALYASGLRAAGLENAAAHLTWDNIQKFDLSRFGFYIADPLRDYINQTVGGKTIEQFPTRFAALAADLHTGNARLFDRGEAGLAVQASASTPGVFQPKRIDGRTYVDGGVVSPVPVGAARRLGAQTVIAVNVSFPP